jgi:hypothetical protein
MKRRKGQLNLFSMPKLEGRIAVRKERDDALKQVEENAAEQWKREALNAIHQTALQLREFISDDVWEVGALEAPHEARALGPMMLQAAKNGWIVKTNYIKPSVRSHLSGKPIWLSSIYKGR